MRLIHPSLAAYSLAVDYARSRALAATAWLLLVVLCLGVLQGILTWRLDAGTGLTQTFFHGVGSDRTVLFQRLTPAVDLGILHEAQRLPSSSFVVRWDGFWQVPTRGLYDLYLGADDFVTLRIGGRLLHEGSVHRPGLHAQTVRIEPGFHAIEIEFTQHEGASDLRMLWAPAGAAPRPLDSDRLFPTLPEHPRLRRALEFFRDAIRIGAAIGLLLAVGLLLRAPQTARLRETTSRHVADGVSAAAVRLAGPRAAGRLASWHSEQLARRRYGFAAFLGSAVILTLWTAFTRASGLNPSTLWADDVKLATLARSGAFWTTPGTPFSATVGPGFLGMIQLGTSVVSDPELSAQIGPFLLGLLGPLVVGAIVLRLTSSYALASAAVAVGHLNPTLAYYSTLVRQYTLDYTITALFLLKAVSLSRNPDKGLGWTAVLGVLAAFCSLPSVFSTVAVVNVAVLTAMLPPKTYRMTGSHLRIALGFNLALGLVLALLVLPRANARLVDVWNGAYLPLWPPSSLAGFLHDNALGAIKQALQPVELLFPLTAVGLVWLAWKRDTHLLAGVVVLVLGGLLAASALERYPIGVGAAGRMVIFAYPVVLVIAVAGVDALIRGIPHRRFATGAVAVVAVALALARPAEVAYPDLGGHSGLVRILEAEARDRDAVVLNADATPYLVSYYSRWRSTPVRDLSPNGFNMRIDRPRTFGIPWGPEEAAGLNELGQFLVSERPSRVFFFSTRPDFARIVDFIQGHGYRELRRLNDEPLLVVYARRDQPSG
jgi:hypothetical protein